MTRLFNKILLAISLSALLGVVSPSIGSAQDSAVPNLPDLKHSGSFVSNDIPHEFYQEAAGAISTPPRGNLISWKKGDYVFGASKTPVWIRYQFRTTQSNAGEWYVYPHSDFTHDEVRYVVASGDNIISDTATNNTIPLNERPLQSRYLGGLIKLAPNTDYSVYIGIVSRLDIRAGFSLERPNTFRVLSDSSSAFLGFYSGYMLCFAMFGFLLFVSLADRSYIFFSAFCLSTLALDYVYNGQWDIFLARYLHISGAAIMPVIYPLPILFASLFTREFVNTPTHTPRMDKALRGFTYLAPVLILFALVPATKGFVQAVVDVTIGIASIVLIAVGVVAIKRKLPFALSFLISISALTILSTLWIVVMYGGIDVDFWGYYLGEAGQIAYAGFTTIGLFQKLKALNQQKTEAAVKHVENTRLRTLIRVIYHDLANPMSAVNGYTDLALNLKIDHPKLKKYLQSIASAALSQTEIIQHVRTMQGVESGQSDFTLEPIKVNDSLERIQTTFAARLDEKRQQLQIDSAATDGVWAIGNAAVLTHSILANLISNAIKFSKPDAIIAIGTLLTDTHVSIKVRDSGAGMTHQAVEAINAGLGKQSTQGTAGETGTGSGLMIVYEYTRRMGGSMKVESALPSATGSSGGTTITIQIPRKSASVSASESGSGAASSLSAPSKAA